MVRENGAVVLIDFGLTQKLQTATGHGTRQLRSNTRFGTAGYAPLEQYSNHAQTGVFTDIYALAATLYYLLTGLAPPEATERAAGVQLTDPRSINPRLSTQVLQAILQGLEMDARRRPQSVQAFLDLLQYPQQLQRAQPASPERPPTYLPEPIEIDIPGYSSRPPRRMPPQRSPQPMPPPRQRPEDFEDPFRDPFRGPPMPIIFPGFGCMRGLGCVSGCLFFLVLFILQLLGSIFVLDW
jgi:serine/threonine protein kinase